METANGDAKKGVEREGRGEWIVTGRYRLRTGSETYTQDVLQCQRIPTWGSPISASQGHDSRGGRKQLDHADPRGRPAYEQRSHPGCDLRRNPCSPRLGKPANTGPSTAHDKGHPPEKQCPEAVVGHSLPHRFTGNHETPTEAARCENSHVVAGSKETRSVQ